jgi:hypothetical protein
MRYGLFLLCMLLCSIPSAFAQLSIDINLPGASIGINQPAYPELVAVPGYPVYYAPQADSNYFFYDGMYWVYQQDNWYASSWYNGPWGLVAPEAVPLFVLRIPVRYYRRPPAYFRGWSADAAPRWDEHWGDAWSQRRHGWDTWNRSVVVAPAPLPTYQRQYTGNRYPAAAQQQALQSQNYRYQPHDVVVQQRNQTPQTQPAAASAAQGRPSAPQAKSTPQQAQRGSIPPSSSQQSVTAAPRGQPQGQRSAAAKAAPQQSGQAAEHQKQQPVQAAAPHQQVSKAQRQNQAPASQPKAQHQPQQPQQAAAPHQQVSKAQRQNQAPASQPKTQHQPQQPQQAAAPHQQQAPKAQEKTPQAKGPAQEPKQGQEKG